MKGQGQLGWWHVHTLPHLGAGGREDQELETNLVGTMEIESILSYMKFCPKKWRRNCSRLRNIFTWWGTPGHPNPVLPSAHKLLTVFNTSRKENSRSWAWVMSSQFPPPLLPSAPPSFHWCLFLSLWLRSVSSWSHSFINNLWSDLELPDNSLPFALINYPAKTASDGLCAFDLALVKI